MGLKADKKDAKQELNRDLEGTLCQFFYRKEVHKNLVFKINTVKRDLASVAGENKESVAVERRVIILYTENCNRFVSKFSRRSISIQLLLLAEFKANRDCSTRPMLLDRQAT